MNMKLKATPSGNELLSSPPLYQATHFLAVAASILFFTHTPLNASETDDRIEDSARKSYIFRIILKDDVVKTTSKDGIVTLTGTVAEDSHKTLAQDTVSGLPGVKSVDNQIKVKESPVEQSDTWLYLKVKSALAYRRSVSAYNTKVEVKQGVAILKGEADNEAQKELVTEYVKDVEGIKDVKNEMTVVTKSGKPAPTVAEIIDDASITAQVRMALMTHHSTSAFKTSVSTTDGVVTVGGKASNAAEVELVSKLVNDINGVKSVVNHMIIEAPATK